MIADDVGLGKTIEAGLILWPLLDSKRAQRILILTPASLAEQWQERLREMFDIRFSIYTNDADTDSSDFWNTHDRVVARISTVQMETKNNKRIERVLSSKQWDLVIVDEAHHLNAEEYSGKTLSYQLLEKMEGHNLINSLLFFTGTPHRGKDYGFWSLMKLLNPGVFGPSKDINEQFKQLSNYFIRNNKQHVTDMNGNRLFTDIIQHAGTFTYTQEEENFYNKLTEFIANGKAYANTKDGRAQTRVILVLIALQKIASSSVAAVKSALTTRLKYLMNKAEEQNESNIDERDDTDEAMNEFEAFSKEIIVKLVEDEISYLEELIALAENVREESRIIRIISIIKKQYPNEQILFFTEYKRTQALMLSALVAEWGIESVGFINGDEAITGVKIPDGNLKDFKKPRKTTAGDFNSGKIKYLVSTEASGEGVDLQEKCHVIIHIDLPWNPMRLHQRVGRLSRYGQNKNVEVISMRNPNTIESKIWDLLQTKIASIKTMFTQATDDPEDLMELVLGMQDTNFYNKLFSDANNHRENLETWFDAETQTFGNSSVVNTVERLVGNAAKFNLSGLKDVPKLDLPDLEAFFKASLELAGRRVTKSENGLYSFLTPDSWNNEYSIKLKYQNLIFKRKSKEGDICGIGHPIFQKALDNTQIFPDCLCLIDSEYSFFVYRIYDKITYQRGNVESKFLILRFSDSKTCEFVSDESFFKELQNFKSNNNANNTKPFLPPVLEAELNKRIPEYKTLFKEPGYSLFACFFGKSNL
jgi:SNF2 family DNA or RNA helicase